MKCGKWLCDLRKIQGEYLEEIHVICRTATKDSSLLFFQRFFHPDLERIREFNFGIDPSEFDLDYRRPGARAESTAHGLGRLVSRERGKPVNLFRLSILRSSL